MKRTICEIAMAAVLAWVVPWFLVSAVLSAQLQKPDAEPIQTVPTETQKALIPVKTDRGVVTMAFEDYLTAVLLAEMPAFFHMEAKMAQAVVARTYALRTVAMTDKHPGAVCCDSNCCQGYCSVEDYLHSGGTQEAVDQARNAVIMTDGLVLTYNGALIDATYFACSGGYTEPAVAVWGTDVPYLQAVPSPGEETAFHFTDVVVFSFEAFQKALGITIHGNVESWFGPVTYTQGGGVAWMTIGSRRYSGTQLRSLLGLRSTAFTVSLRDNKIYITTKGHGHRVGMSQYGANAMAEDGKYWRQILSHYYPGTQVVILPQK